MSKSPRRCPFQLGHSRISNNIQVELNQRNQYLSGTKGELRIEIFFWCHQGSRSVVNTLTNEFKRIMFKIVFKVDTG